MKILYLQHIPWNWIKQRPQFLAEELHKNFAVDVIESNFWRSKPSASKPAISLYSFFNTPAQRFLSMVKINEFRLTRFVTKRFKNKDYDLVWISHPQHYHAVKKLGLPIVYDCMDDFLEFPAIKKNPKLSSYYAQLEKELCQAASIVFCTSAYLAAKIKLRTGVQCKILRNGLANDFKIFPKNTLTSHDAKIAYFGTISEWFDFSLVQKLAEQFEIHLYGPLEVNLPTIKNVSYHGSVAHAKIQAEMQKYDVLIMPFIINELIKSVNPVKLYEYVASGKVVLAPDYEETRVFEDFIFRYKSFADILNHLKSHTSLTDDSIRKEFVQNSTWSGRLASVLKDINLLAK